MIPCEEEIQIRDMARQFAQERLKPFAADWDREHRFPAEAIREMADLGFLGMLVPEEWAARRPGTWPTPWPSRRSPLATAPARPS